MSEITPKYNLRIPAAGSFTQATDIQDSLRKLDEVGQEHNADGTHKTINTPNVVTPKITLPDGTITSAANIGGTAQTLAQAIALGKEADLAGVDFALKDGTRDLLRVHATKGLQGMIGNINAPLVHIPMKRANDALRLSGTETYTRSTTTTYTDPLTGLLKTAAINDPVYERCSDGIIRQRFEPSSTNQCTNSTVATRVSAITRALGVAPDGTTTAENFVKPAVTNSSAIGGFPINISSPIGTVLTVSFYMKTIGTGASYGIHSSLFGYVNMPNPIADPNAVFNPSTGYYRVSMQVTTTGTGAGAVNIFHDSYSSSTGDGINGNYVWGFQVEAGTIASSYIPTTAGAVTRAADSPLTIPVSGNFPTLDFTKDFCIVVDYESPRLDTQADGVTSNIFEVVGVQNILMRHGSGFTNSAQIFVGAINGMNIPRTTATANQAHRFALVNRNGTMEAWFDNVLVGTKASTAITGTATSIIIGRYDYLRTGEVRIYDFAPAPMGMGAI